MVNLSPWALAVLGLAGLASGQAAQPDALKQLENKGRPSIDARLAKSTTCTKAKLRVRREYGDLSKDERRDYVAAVRCLLAKPSKIPAAKCPGCKSRYDDFVAVHINQTLSIHGTGNFLSWHRYYTWAFETSLRDECGYKGAQPYWDYGRWAQDPLGSPLFDGSDTSLSGNGKTMPNSAAMLISAGNGGGCVETGPFRNMTVYLGPMSPAISPAPARNPRADGLGANPRCLRRAMSNQLTSRYGRTQDVVRLITSSANIGTFQTVMQGQGLGTLGIHMVGHFTINGDPGGDFYVSPNDPAFWVHHGSIDRIWTIWQSQDLENRLNVIQGGTSMLGGGRQQSLDDPIDLGYVAPEPGKTYKIRELVSIVDGPLCYVYE